MGDWADSALNRMREAKRKNELQQEAFVEKQRVKKAQAPAIWSKVRGHVEFDCGELNRKAGETLLGFRDMEQGRLEVKLAGDDRVLRIVFDFGSGTLRWGCSGGKGDAETGSWDIQVDTEGSVHLADKFGPTRPKYAAEAMLNALLR